MSESFDSMIFTYVEDSEEVLQKVRGVLLELEEYPGDIELLNQLFRAIHTLKGSSSFMGFTETSAFTHSIESLLQTVREGDSKFSGKTADVFFKSVDILASLIDDIRKNGKEIPRDLTGINIDISEAISSASPKIAPDESGRDERKVTSADGARTGDTGSAAVKGSFGSEFRSQDDILLSLSVDDLTRLVSLGALEKAYYLCIDFVLESYMPLAKAMLVMRKMELSTDIVSSFPPREYLEEEFNGMIELVVISDLPPNSIKVLLDEEEIRVVELNIIENERVEEALESIRNLAKISANRKDERQKPLDSGTDSAAAQDSVARKNGTAPVPVGAPSIAVKDESESVHVEEKAVEPVTGEKTERITGENRARAQTENSGDSTVRKTGGKAKPREMKGKPETIRVDIQKFDRLMNLMGELVINRTRNHDLMTDIRSVCGDTIQLDSLEESFQEQGRIVYEIQESIMNSRLVPVGLVFNNVPLVVRDIAGKSGKLVKCVITGESTELDKKLVDGIKEPMLHLVRNAVDHGIEMPEDRKKIGKEEAGTLFLDAYQEYNQVIISIRDDGAGLDREKIIKRAVEKKLIAAGDEIDLPDGRLLELICQPGFSTNDEVSNSSGRGVGMDVVKKSVNGLNGSMEIFSRLGEGTSVRLRLPITLAIIQGLLVKSGEMDFAIPINSISEILSLARNEIHHSSSGEMILRLREEILNIYYLSELLGIESQKPKNNFHVVIIDNFGKKIGVIVDSLTGEREIVIKSLNNAFLDIEGIAGASIMGDGRVVMIIDVPVLLKKNKKIGSSLGLKIFSSDAAGVYS